MTDTHVYQNIHRHDGLLRPDASMLAQGSAP